MSHFKTDLETKDKLYLPNLYNCDLKLGARLVLAYLIYRHGYNDDPSDLQINRHTGLSRTTIANIRHDLEVNGWWKDGPTAKFLSHTKATSNKLGYQFFTCYCRVPGSRLSSGAIAMWSLLYHYATTTSKPPRITYSYLDEVLGLSGSSKNCLDSLKSAGWIDFNIDGKTLSFKFKKIDPNDFITIREYRDNEEAPTSFSFDLDCENIATICEKDYNTCEILTTTGETDADKLIEYLEPKLSTFPQWESNKNAIIKMRGKTFPQQSFPAIFAELFDTFSRGEN